MLFINFSTSLFIYSYRIYLLYRNPDIVLRINDFWPDIEALISYVHLDGQGQVATEGRMEGASDSTIVHKFDSVQL